MHDPTDAATMEHGVVQTEPALPPGALAVLDASLEQGAGRGRGARSVARNLGALTSVLVLALVAAAGFLGGVQVQKHQQTGTTRVATAGTGTAGGAGARPAAGGGATATTAATGATGDPTAAGQAGGGGFAGRRGAAGGTGAAPGGATGAGAAGAGAAGAPAGQRGAGGGAAAGQVKLVDGANLYVTDNQGNTVKVTTSDSSRFTKTATGSINDVRPGDTVIVQGQKGPDGIVTATVVADTGGAAG